MLLNRRPLLRAALLPLALAWLPGVLAADAEHSRPGPAKPGGPPPAHPAGKVLHWKLERPAEAPALARQAVRTFLSDKAWEAEVKKVRRRYAHWHEEHEADAGRFLNDRMVGVVLGAYSGKIEKIQKGALWLAFYREFKQPIPSWAAEFIERNKDSLNRLLGAFTWARARQYLKHKQWVKDAKAKREKEKAARKQRKKAAPEKQKKEKLKEKKEPKAGR